MKHILVIGEKTSQVKKFAETLCGSYQSKKQAKYVYTYTGKTKLGNETYKITFLPLAGHIIDIDTNKGYEWGNCPPIKIVYDYPRSLKLKNKRKYVTILRKNVKGKDELWLATDPDAEGDNIAWEVLKILDNHLNVPVKRIWNSSLTATEIYRAFLYPKPWNNNLALGVLGRRFIDAWLGFAGTREITRAARQVAKVKVLSVGRVQLPTLYLIVNQDLAHETFVPQDKFSIQANLIKVEDEFTAKHSMGYITNEEKVKDILSKIKGTDSATITNVETQIDRKLPPIPLNTTAAVSLLSKVMKITAKRGLDNMVELYNRGLISYPRTENKKFKKGFPHKDIISSLTGISKYTPYIKLIKNTKQVRRNGPMKGEEEDHDPIHPTGELKGISNLNKQLSKTYDILTRYYLSLFMPDLIIEKVNADLSIAKEKFITDGRTIKDLGWRKAQWWKTTKTRYLPQLQSGDKVSILDISIKSKKTKPPKQMTDSELLLEMEKVGIGTKSSRPDIIRKIERRNYIKRKGSKLISTTWGRALIASLAPIWPEVVIPKFTSHVEALMDKVAKGQQSFDNMIKQLKHEYIQLHQQLIPNIHDYQQLLKQLNLSDQKSDGKLSKKRVNDLLLKVTPELST